MGLLFLSLHLFFSVGENFLNYYSALSTKLKGLPSVHIVNSSTYHSGEKKKHRKEMIAVKRRERMLLRGVDLEQINLVKAKRKLNVVALPFVVFISIEIMESILMPFIF